MNFEKQESIVEYYFEGDIPLFVHVRGRNKRNLYCRLKL